MKPDSVFFITGAASGIGAATAAHAVARGHRAVVCDVNEAAAAALCARLGAQTHPLHLDVRSAAEWELALDAAWRHFGGVDVLVNNAGLIYTGWVRDLTLERIQHMVDVNLLGLIKGVRATVPRFIEQRRGHVINVGSLASFVPMPGQAVYAATKHAVRAFHHGCALEYQASPVSFTLVCPGAVDTPMLRQQLDDDAATLSFAEEALTAEQVAEAIYAGAESRAREILVPAMRGESLRIAGVYPGVVAQMVRRAQRQGRRAMARKRDTKPQS